MTFVSQLSADCSLMAFSEDDGVTWTQNPVGCGVASGADHQTVGGGAWAATPGGVGYADSVYYCAQAIATAQCAVSHTGGLAFDPAVPIYTALQSGGDDQKSSFTGVWHLYVATTYDGGATWTTVDATPTDPVQRGCIWLGGGSNQCRNLLDFMDVTVDPIGRVVVGYADGCTTTCVSGGTNTHSAVATIARQSGGTGLFAAHDGQITG